LRASTQDISTPFLIYFLSIIVITIVGFNKCSWIHIYLGIIIALIIIIILFHILLLVVLFV